ncbi:MAG: hypothetical protein OXF64_02230 [bacterium]|nr:hypothetical protein [bacterium]
MTESQASEWQQRITGEWYGLPSVFDAEGNHTGFNKVSRSSVFADGKVTYWMQCNFMNTGPLRNRFEIRDFEFGVDDRGNDRIYQGPDFYGAGHPYGSLVDSHYYAPGWRADLNTMNQILPDGVTQVYSSLLYEGPTIFSVFNGVYLNAHDYDTNPETKAWIDAHIEAEREMAARPHTVPDRTGGTWTGECEVFGADQQRRGAVSVRLRHDPIDLVRASHALELSGAINYSHTYIRTRSHGNRYTYDGPDLWGNAIAYGRALYTSQHHVSEAFKVKGREFIIDRDHTLAVAWKLYAGDRMTDIVFGPLTFTPAPQKREG